MVRSVMQTASGTSTTTSHGRKIMRISIFLLSVTLAMVCGAFPLAADERDEAVNARVQELLPWVAEKTGYSYEYVKPVIHFRTQEFLNEFYYGANYRDGYADVEAAATGNVIFLREDFTLGENDDTLVHELVHTLQNENGAVFPCVAAMERQAYDLQDVFVEEFGIGEATDPLFKMLITACPIGRGVP